MSEMPHDIGTRFHISLNVRSLERSVEFFRVLFGKEPAKRFDDYAKFEVVDPPVVLSMSPQVVTCGGVLSNIGVQVADDSVLAAIEERLAAAGMASRRQTDALCGYARQVKLWVQDPDENHWELYVPGEDVDPAIVERSCDGGAAEAHADESPAGQRIWEHQLADGPTDRIPCPDGTLDEVHLRGTWNTPASEDSQIRLLREAFRALRPSGTIVVHGLVADHEFPAGQPALPGLAGLVARVPVEQTPLAALGAAGFVGITVTKLSGAPVFQHDGVEMREQRVLAWKPAELNEHHREVLYKGPFCDVTDESGNVYRRGQRAKVSGGVWERLRASAAAEQFLFFEPHGDTKVASSQDCSTC